MFIHGSANHADTKSDRSKQVVRLGALQIETHFFSYITWQQL
jgi:hypothetical protein